MRRHPSCRPATAAAVAVSLVLGVAASFAHAHPIDAVAVGALAALDSTLARVEIYDRTRGAVLPIYPSAGRNWIEGVPGHEYAVRIRNRSGARILVVTSVDGVNVITGDTAAPSQSGYVLEPYGMVEIAGWRKSMSRTAAFYFTDLGDSYAARTGRPNDVGVIGVAVFRERATPPVTGSLWNWRERWTQDARDQTAERARAAEAGGFLDHESAAAPPPTAQAQPAPNRPSAAAPARSGTSTEAEAPRAPTPERAEAVAKLGTGHGRSENSRVTLTAFERATNDPAEIVVLRYDRRENLVALGVLPPPSPRMARRDPMPFPGLRFAPDPR